MEAVEKDIKLGKGGKGKEVIRENRQRSCSRDLERKVTKDTPKWEIREVVYYSEIMNNDPQRVVMMTYVLRTGKLA